MGPPEGLWGAPVCCGCTGVEGATGAGGTGPPATVAKCGKGATGLVSLHNDSSGLAYLVLQDAQ